MEINHIFTLGWRCNSTKFLNTYNLRRISSPFDWVIIDFETSVENIKTKFEKYLDSVVKYQKNKTTTLLYSNNGVIAPLFKKMDDLDLSYMLIDWNYELLHFNQNFLPTKLSGNVYDWDRVCLFRHLTGDGKYFYNKTRSRIDNFTSVLNKSADKTLLLYISKIIDKGDVEKLKREYVGIVEKHKMTNLFWIVLGVSGGAEVSLERVGNVWFCTLPVPPYEEQLHSQSGNENDLGVMDYDKMYLLMKQSFKINIIAPPAREPKSI